jgi:ferrous-iron efflux pump FieF
MSETREYLRAAGNLTRRAAIASVSAALILAVAKTYAVSKTGSVAMLGSLADSALDLIAALVTLVGVRVAAEPADREHRFGHGKAEAIAALLQSVLIFLSACGIAWRAVIRMMEPAAPTAPALGIGVSVLAILVTLALVAYQRHVVRATQSLAIDTDRLHYQSDFLLNLSVIAALAMEAWLGLRGADALFGLVIALWLAWGAYGAARGAVDMLMDREWQDDERERLKEIVTALPGVDGIHELKTRRSGHTDFIQFHIWVDPKMTVEDAHGIVDRVEARVAETFKGAEILVHVDPRGHYDERTIQNPIEDTNDARRA